MELGESELGESVADLQPENDSDCESIPSVRSMSYSMCLSPCMKVHFYQYLLAMSTSQLINLMDTGGVAKRWNNIIAISFIQHWLYITMIGRRVKCYGSQGSVQTYPYIESDPSGPPRINEEISDLASKAISNQDLEVSPIIDTCTWVFRCMV